MENSKELRQSILTLSTYIPIVVNTVFAFMPRSARKSRIHAAIGRILTSILPSNRIQHDYKHSSECTAIVVKHSHRRNWSTCQEHIYNLPYELRAMIMDHYFEAILVPGEIEPIPCKAHRGSDCFLYNKSSFWCRDALRIMRSKVFNHYQQRYWSENTLIVRFSPTIKVLERLPREITDSIRSVRLVLGRDDDRIMASEYDEGQFVFDNNTRRPFNRTFGRRELVTQWVYAGIYLSSFKLQHLVIDVRYAYFTEGKWLVEYWTTRFFEIRPRLPRNFEIIRPNSDLTEDLRYEINRHLYGR